MNASVAARRVVHISDSPDESQLLVAELAGAQERVAVTRVASRAALERELASGAVDLVIADLPLPWAGAHDEIGELQRTRPEIEVIFRWGEPGARNCEPESLQIERLVSERLHRSATRPQSESERRALMRELARRQEALLRLQRSALWEFDAALKELARVAAELLAVERVSVWEFSADHSALDCAVLYQRSRGSFESGAHLISPPRYMRALESTLSLVAHDCQRDPRTSDFARDYLVPLGISSLLDAPVRVEGQVVAVLCIEHVGPQRHWSVLDQCAASSLACHLARVFEVRRRRALEQRVASLERLDTLGRVAGQIAHDFNNRLTVLAGWLGLLRHDVQSGSSAEHCLTELERELARAETQVRELLSLGQPSDQAAGPIDARAQLEQHAGTLRRVLGENVRVEVDVRTDDTQVAIAQRDFESLLLNLAANSRDALAGSGGVRVILEDGAPPAPLPGAPASTLRLVFEDDGPGFSEQALAHLFEPLFTTKAPGRGSGLGLSSIARVVRRAGGEVRAGNRAPRGARVELELPRAR